MVINEISFVSLTNLQGIFLSSSTTTEFYKSEVYRRHIPYYGIRNTVSFLESIEIVRKDQKKKKKKNFR